MRKREEIDAVCYERNENERPIRIAKMSSEMERRVSITGGGACRALLFHAVEIENFQRTISVCLDGGDTETIACLSVDAGHHFAVRCRFLLLQFSEDIHMRPVNFV